MMARQFLDNKGLIDGLLSAYKAGDLVLTPSKRLAHRIIHCHRRLMIESEITGWEPPRVVSLASWIGELSLIRNIPEVASRYLRWAIFLEITDDINPPEPLTRNIRLARFLDNALSALIRHNVKWDEFPEGDGYLYLWRNRVFRRFFKAIRSKKMIHPEEVPIFAGSAAELPVYLPENLHLVLLDTLSPSEQELMSIISTKVKTLQWGVVENIRGRKDVEWISFEDPDEEIKWAVTEVLEASAKFPLHSLGIVVMDPESQIPILERCLAEIIGKPVEGYYGSYNITYGSYLADTGLFKAMLLPLRFWLEGEPRQLLNSFLLSSYYGLWQGKRDEISTIDLEFRTKNIHRNVYSVFRQIALTDRFSPLLMPETWMDQFVMLRNFRGRVEEWFSCLENFWKKVSFPVLGDEIDEIAWKHLREMQICLAQNLDEQVLNLKEFYEWLTIAAGDTLVSSVGYEDAGIQVMSPLDARGLYFDRLWILGLTGNSFPQPVRDIPFLSPREAKYVQGCTPESQWHFARSLFSKLLGASPNIVVTRHSVSKSEVVPLSPFWGEGEVKKKYSIWRNETGWWVRSDIFGQAIDGARSPSAWALPDNLLTPPVSIGEISVSDLELLLQCPFKFLVESLLGIEPLKEETIGIHPVDRGILLHRVLEKYVKRVIDEDISLDSERAIEVLEDVSRKIMAKMEGSPYHDLELRRWLDSERGLLTAWVEVERRRLTEGYRWKFAEVPFGGLKVGKLILRGRIDRIDTKDDGRVVCLEYKTGAVPSRKNVFGYMTQPQLPSYFLAIREGLVKGFHQRSKNSDQITTIVTCYASLKKASEVRIVRYEPSNQSWGEFIDEWKSKINERLEPVLMGIFDAIPLPSPEETGNSPCRFCPFHLLCNRFSVAGEVEDYG